MHHEKRKKKNNNKGSLAGVRNCQVYRPMHIWVCEHLPAQIIHATSSSPPLPLSPPFFFLANGLLDSLEELVPTSAAKAFHTQYNKDIQMYTKHAQTFKSIQTQEANKHA